MSIDRSETVNVLSSKTSEFLSHIVQQNENNATFKLEKNQTDFTVFQQLYQLALLCTNGLLNYRP